MVKLHKITTNHKVNRMSIEITSKHLEITPAIKDAIASQFKKLERHLIDLINSHVIITQEPQGFKIEANVVIPQGKLFAHAQDNDLYAAIHSLGQKLERQLNKHTHKSDSHRDERNAKKINRTADIEAA
jgi:ribosome-associated inhibitor A